MCAGTPKEDFNAQSPASLINYYRGQLAIALANNIAYRASLIIWVISGIMQPLVSLVVWQAVAESRGGTAAGLTSGEYASYFIITMLVNHFTFSWHMWEFEWRIRTGSFTPILLRPIHPIHNDINENLTNELVGLISIVPGAIAMGVIFNADFSSTDWQNVIAFLPALVLEMVLRFVIEWTLALAAFWLTKVAAINNLFDVLVLFLGGQFAPLAVMPGMIQSIANALPFRWIIAFPAEVALNQREGSEVLTGYGMQILWIVIAILALALIWKRAMRQFTAVGT